MFKRRKVGPAYELSPAEVFQEWAMRNVLILIAAVAVWLGLWVVLDWVIDYLLNFLVRGIDEASAKPFDSTSPVCWAAKIFVCSFVSFMICRSRVD